jgi:hypothetical protein
VSARSRLTARCLRIQVDGMSPVSLNRRQSPQTAFWGLEPTGAHTGSHRPRSSSRARGLFRRLWAKLEASGVRPTLRKCHRLRRIIEAPGKLPRKDGGVQCRPPFGTQ